MSLWARSIYTEVPSLHFRGSDERKMVFLDIETTSLSPRAGGVTLVGLTYAVPGGRVVEQHFVDHPRDEGRVLRKAARRVAQFSTVVTYHGLGFDIPFLQARAERHGSDWPELQHWDLLPNARRWRRTYRAPENCRLQTVLEHFALDREDDTTGADMVAAYQRWLSKHCVESRQIVLEHNADDVRLLPELAHVLSERQRARGQAPGGRVRRGRSQVQLVLGN